MNNPRLQETVSAPDSPRPNVKVKHPVRVLVRLVWMTAEFALAAARFPRFVAFRRGADRTRGRARWLHRSSLRVLRVLGLRPESAGELPSSGLLVCNHLSYLDILVLAALTPCVFVSKREVRSWPVLGWFALLGGTVFVHRERRSQTVEAAEGIEGLLGQGALVVLFPEGTSSNGETVLPFKSSLLEPAAHDRHPLAVGFIRYEVAEGDVAEDVCYWRDMTFVPHLFNLLSLRRVWAHVRFLRQPPLGLNRKKLAVRLQEEILKLKEANDRRPTR